MLHEEHRMEFKYVHKYRQNTDLGSAEKCWEVEASACLLSAEATGSPVCVLVQM